MILESEPGDGGAERRMMPAGLVSFVASMGWKHQIGIAVLSIAVFALDAAPLEIQRRIVNSTAAGASYNGIVLLVALYLGLLVTEGITKLVLNVYRGWIGEVSILWLRGRVLASSDGPTNSLSEALDEGVQLSIVLAEAEPIGSFVGSIFSEPLLQAGILLAVCGYLAFLQPLVAGTVAVIFAAQIAFVPLMQRAINKLVADKIGVLRDVSEGMVESSLGGLGRNLQVDRIGRLFTTDMSINKLKYLLNFLMNLSTQIGYAGIFLIGGYYFVTGRTEIGTVVAFVSGLSKIADPWGALVDWYQNLTVTIVKYAMVRDAGKQVSALANISSGGAKSVSSAAPDQEPEIDFDQ